MMQSVFARPVLVESIIVAHLPAVPLRALELVHSDVCGKIQEKSLGGAEYFLTFTDEKTRYTWVYILKTKDQVFNHFRNWKQTNAKKL